MRGLFLLLLVINIFYVAWEYSRTVASASASISLKQNVPQIALLHELEPKRSQGSPSEKLVSKKPIDKTGHKVSEKPAPVNTATAAKAAAMTAKSESGSDKKKSAGRSKQKRHPVTTVSTGDGCYTLGPFRELTQLSAFTRGIKNYVQEASFRSREEREQSMFWVYLKPAANKKAADQLRRELTANKIKDHYVISSGPNNNGVSLGHFRQKDGAYSHSAAIKKLGFEPVVEPVFKSYTIYWLDYRVQPGKGIPQQLFDKHLARSVSRIDRPCT